MRRLLPLLLILLLALPSAAPAQKRRAPGWTPTQMLPSDALPPALRRQEPGYSLDEFNRSLPPATPPAPPLVVPEPTPKARTYNRLSYLLYFVNAGWTWLGLWLFFRLGLSAKMRDRADTLVLPRVRHAVWRGLARAAVYYAVFSAGILLWHLPFNTVGYVVEHTYGFATFGPGLWLFDKAKNYLFGLINILVVWFGYGLLTRSPKRWWLWLAAAAIPWTLLSIVLYPLVIAPTYNDFRPLQNAALRGKLETLAAKAGISGAQVLEVDISRRTTKLNAYVTGLGPSRRIVLWDTTLHALSDDEIEGIMGHEIGHYVMGHIWGRWLMNVFGAFSLLGILATVLPRLVKRFGSGGRVARLDDLASLPLVLLVLSVLIFLQTPVESAFTRYQEHQADKYGIELTGKNEATARAFIAFVVRDFADPDPPPFLVFWFYSHPPIRERIDFVLHYHPSQSNTP